MPKYRPTSLRRCGGITDRGRGETISDRRGELGRLVFFLVIFFIFLFILNNCEFDSKAGAADTIQEWGKALFPWSRGQRAQLGSSYRGIPASIYWQRYQQLPSTRVGPLRKGRTIHRRRRSFHSGVSSTGSEHTHPVHIQRNRKYGSLDQRNHRADRSDDGLGYRGPRPPCWHGMLRRRVSERQSNDSPAPGGGTSACFTQEPRHLSRVTRGQEEYQGHPSEPRSTRGGYPSPTGSTEGSSCKNPS